MSVRVSKLIKVLAGIDMTTPTEPYTYNAEEPTICTERLSYILIKVLSALRDNDYAAEVMTDIEEPIESHGATKSGIVDMIMGLIPVTVPVIWRPVVEVVIPELIEGAVDIALSPELALRDVAVNSIDSVLDFILNVVRDIIYENYIADHPEESVPKPGEGSGCCEEMIAGLEAIKTAIDEAKTLQRAISFRNIKIADDGSWVDMLQEG
jgi:hypothetical protein